MEEGLGGSGSKGLVPVKLKPFSAPPGTWVWLSPTVSDIILKLWPIYFGLEKCALRILMIVKLRDGPARKFLEDGLHDRH